jgi:hypothetical protein
MTQGVSILGRSVKFLRIGVIAYLIGGIAYWTAAELFLRYVGKEIVPGSNQAPSTSRSPAHIANPL